MGGFEKSHLVGFLPLTKKGRVSGLAEARRICALRVPYAIGADEEVRIERLCISLPYVETFNSKVIKGCVPELRSRYVFFVFRDSYVLCIYVMNILCTFRIFMYGYGTYWVSLYIYQSLAFLSHFLLRHFKVQLYHSQNSISDVLLFTAASPWTKIKHLNMSIERSPYLNNSR